MVVPSVPAIVIELLAVSVFQFSIVSVPVVVVTVNPLYVFPVRASELDIVGTVTPLAFNLPVPFGTRLMCMFVEEPVAVSVIVPVPQATL